MSVAKLCAYSIVRSARSCPEFAFLTLSLDSIMSLSRSFFSFLRSVSLAITVSASIVRDGPLFFGRGGGGGGGGGKKNIDKKIVCKAQKDQINCL